MKDASSSDFKVPQITPQAERRRLVAKGNFLAEHCLVDGHMDCVLGFVDHCLGKSPPQLDVIVELWDSLRQAYEQPSSAGETGDESPAFLRQALLGEVAARLKEALKSL